MTFLIENLATILIGLLVFGALGAVIVKLIRDHKAHKSSCSCGCGNCSNAGFCHSDK